MKLLISIHGKNIPNKPWHYHEHTYIVKEYDDRARLNCQVGSTGTTCTTSDSITTCMAYEAEGIPLNSEEVFKDLFTHLLNQQYSEEIPTFENLDSLNSLIIFRIFKKDSQPSQPLSEEDKKQIENTNKYHYSEHYKTDLGKIAYLGMKELLLRMLANETFNPGKANNDALLSAVKGGHLELVILLCNDLRVRLNNTGSNGLISPLYHACVLGHFAIVKFLLELVSKSREKLNGYLVFDILYNTAKNGHLGIIRLLLQDDNMINQVMSEIPRLIRAALNANLMEFILLLLEFRPIREKQPAILQELSDEQKLSFESIIPKMHLTSCRIFRNGFFFDSNSSLNRFNQDIIDEISCFTLGVVPTK